MIFYSDCLNQESALEVTLLTSNAGLKQRDRFYPALSLSLSLSLSQDAYFWNSGSMPYGSPNHMDRPHGDILVSGEVLPTDQH